MNTRGMVLIGEALSDGSVRTRYIPEAHAARPNGPDGKGQWNEKWFRNVPVPQQMVERMQANLPAVVRRDPRERYRSMLERISRDAIESYRVTGQVRWPRSVEEELKVIAWKNGDPTLTELGGIEQVQRQVEALTRHVVETGEMAQKAQDRKKVTLDWAGH